MGIAPSLYRQNLFNNNVNIAGTTDRINSTTKIMAITFTAKGGDAKKVSFYVHGKTGTSTTVYNIRVVKCLPSGTPSGTNVSDAVTDLANANITTNKWHTITFGSKFTLTAGSSYGIQIRGKTSQSSTQYITIRSNTPHSTTKPDETSDNKHNFWYYSGSAWTKRDRTSPFIVFSSTNGYVDGHLHENGALSLLPVDNNFSAGEKVKFAQPFTATSFSVFYDWATISDPGNGNEPVVKIYSPTGTLLSSVITTYNDAPGSGTWRTYQLKTKYGVATAIYFDTSGFYTIIAKSGAANGVGWGMGFTQSFVQTANPVSAQYLHAYAKYGTTWAYGISTSVSQESLWGTDSFRRYNNATDGYYDMPFKLGYHIIGGNIKSNLNTNLSGASVKLKSGTIVISSANTDSSGNYSIRKYQKGTYRLQPYYNDWEFTPQAVVGTIGQVPTATFVQDTESKWWDEDSASGKGRHFAFRNRIVFSTPHGILPIGYVNTGLPFKTGDKIVIGNNGEFNESIGWIASRDKYSFIVYRDYNANHRIIRYDKSDYTYTETVVGNSGSNTDLHYMPSCEVDKNGIVYVFFDRHDSRPLQYYKGLTPYSISDLKYHETKYLAEDFSGEPPEAGTKGHTYIWPKYRESDKSIYLFFRAETAANSYRGFIKQSLLLTSSSYVIITGDDARHYYKQSTSSTMQTTDYLTIGNLGPELCDAYCNFKTEMAQSTQVSSVHASFYCRSSNANPASFKIKAIKTGNSGVFINGTAGVTDILSRTYTTSSVIWNIPSTTTNNWYNTPNLKILFDEVNALYPMQKFGIVVQDNNNASDEYAAFASYDYTESLAPKIFFSFPELTTFGGINGGFDFGKFFARDKASGTLYPITSRSIYSAGTYFDQNGYCYTALDYHYGYGGTPEERWDFSINFYYSTDMTTWKTINGTIVGYSTPHIKANVANDAHNYCTTAEGALWKKETNPGSSGNHKGYNTDGLGLTNKRWNNGVDTIYLPFIGFQSSVGYLSSGQDLCIAYYSTVNAQWQIENITKKTGIPFYLGRSGSFGMSKPSGEINVFAMMNTSDSRKNQQWSNVEPIVFTTTADYFGGSWKYRFLERNSMVGNAMMAIRNPHYYNNEIEMIYGAGKDIVYYSTRNKHGYVRTDGNDLRIVYKGSEIPRVADSYNNLSSNIKFKIQKTITAGATFDTAGNYYIYYGNESTTNAIGVASANPKNIFSFFENFEQYNDGVDLNATFSWTKVSVSTSSNYTFRILSPKTSPSVNGLKLYPSSYYTYSGLKSCLMADSTYGNSTVYCETSIGTNLSNYYLRGHIRKHSYDVAGNIHSFIGVKTGTGTIYALGQTATSKGSGVVFSYSYFNGSRWAGISTINPCNIYWNSPLEMRISSVSGMTFYRYSTGLAMSTLYTLATAKSFNKIVFGGSKVNSNNITIFDFIRMNKI